MTSISKSIYENLLTNMLEGPQRIGMIDQDGAEAVLNRILKYLGITVFDPTTGAGPSSPEKIDAARLWDKTQQKLIAVFYEFEDGHSLSFNPSFSGPEIEDYRKKLRRFFVEPTLQPYTPEEAFKKLKPNALLRKKSHWESAGTRATTYEVKALVIGKDVTTVKIDNWTDRTLRKLLEDFVHQDGSPCGVVRDE